MLLLLQLWWRRWASASTVLSIGDGDTIRVRQGGRAITVRLACIDAPEMAQRPHGQRARDYLRMRLPIGFASAAGCENTDRYGRTVAEVIGEININLAMVEDGQAFAYRQYLSGCDAREYLDAEVRASRRRHGVWQVPGGITRPWDFRRSPRARTIPDGTTPDGQALHLQGDRLLCPRPAAPAPGPHLPRWGWRWGGL